MHEVKNEKSLGDIVSSKENKFLAKKQPQSKFIDYLDFSIQNFKKYIASITSDKKEDQKSFPNFNNHNRNTDDYSNYSQSNSYSKDQDLTRNSNSFSNSNSSDKKLLNDNKKDPADQIMQSKNNDNIRIQNTNNTNTSISTNQSNSDGSSKVEVELKEIWDLDLIDKTDGITDGITVAITDGITDGTTDGIIEQDIDYVINSDQEKGGSEDQSSRYLSTNYLQSVNIDEREEIIQDEKDSTSLEISETDQLHDKETDEISRMKSDSSVRDIFETSSNNIIVTKESIIHSEVDEVQKKSDSIIDSEVITSDDDSSKNILTVGDVPFRINKLDVSGDLGVKSDGEMYEGETKIDPKIGQSAPIISQKPTDTNVKTQIFSDFSENFSQEKSSPTNNIIPIQEVTPQDGNQNSDPQTDDRSQRQLGNFSPKQTQEFTESLELKDFEDISSLKFADKVNFKTLTKATSNHPEAKLEQTTKPSEQVTMAIKNNLAKGNFKISVKLEPEALGRVDIDIQVLKNQIKEVKLTFEKQTALQEFIKDQSQLEKIIAEITKSTDVNINLNFRQTNQENKDPSEPKTSTNQRSNQEISVIKKASRIHTDIITENKIDLLV